MDYTAVSRLLRIEACEKKMCVHIPIVNDFIKEGMESFNVTLERTEYIPLAVTADPAEAEIQIFERSK